VLEVPQEAPEILSTSVTFTSVHVSWTSPFFVAAPLIGYRVSVTASDGTDNPNPGGGRRPDRVIERLVSNMAEQPIMSEVVTLLRPDTRYVVNVAALNKFGAGVSATAVVRTLPHNVGEM